MKPLPTRPSPPPTPNTRRHHADRDAHLLGRELVADDPEARAGTTAAPVPWSTRQATSHAKDPTPAPRPTSRAPNTARHTTSSRFLPYMSPSLPSSGVSTDELSRKPVTSHVVSACDVPNSLPEERQRRDHERLHDREGDARDREQGERDPVCGASPPCRRGASRGVFRPNTLEGMDDEPTSSARPGARIAAFQRLFGEHAPDAELLERRRFVASAVPEQPRRR